MTYPANPHALVAQIALWLAESIGEGNVFTYDMLSQRFGAERLVSAERRIRDLRRGSGWQFWSFKDDPELRPGQLRLVKIGDRVWEPGVPRPHPQVRSTKAREIEALELEQLPESDLHAVLSWMKAGERPRESIDDVWDAYRHARSPALRDRLQTMILIELGKRAVD